MIKKHRNGPAGDVDLYFDKERVTFHNLEKNTPSQPPPPTEIIAPF